MKNLKAQSEAKPSERSEHTPTPWLVDEKGDVRNGQADE